MSVAWPTAPAASVPGDTGNPVHFVNNSTELRNRISARVADHFPEDIVVADNVTVQGQQVNGYNWNGSQTGIVAGRTLRVFGGTNSKMVHSGSNADGAVWKVRNSVGVELHSMECDGESTGANGAFAIIVFGARWDNDPNRGDSHYSVVSHCDLHHSRQAIIKCDGDGNSSHGKIIANEIHHAGLSGGSGQGFGEGCYVGDGNTKRAHTDATISYNHIWEINDGEGINVKRNCDNATMMFNHIHRVTIDSGGVITTEAFNCTSHGDRIYDASKVQNGDDEADGYEIVSGDLAITSALVWGVSGSGISLVRTNSAYIGTVTCRNSLINADRGKYRINFEGYAGSTHQTLTASDNLILGNASIQSNGNVAGSTYTGDLNVTAADFVGPITGNADAGTGPGSGFELVAGSPAVNSANSSTSPVTDAQGANRDAQPDKGPLELGSGTIDDTPPTSSIDPIGLVGLGALTVTGTASDNASAVPTVRVRVRRNIDSLYWNGTAWDAAVTWLDTTVTSTGPTSADWSLDLASSAVTEPGDYQFRSYAIDSANNIEDNATRPAVTVTAIGFEVTSPADGEAGVLTPQSIIGTSHVAGTHRIRVENVTDGTVWDGASEFITDIDPGSHWFEWEHSPPADGEFTAGEPLDHSIALPQGGETIRARVERYES